MRATTALLRGAILLTGVAAALALAAVAPIPAAEPEAGSGDAAFGPPSDGCLTCHAGIEPMHDKVEITCVGCHGGDGSAKEKLKAHVTADSPGPFTTSANPQFSWATINQLPPEFVRFMNPGDLRIADLTCGQAKCHATEVNHVRKSAMANNTMPHNAVFYNNGSIDSKIPIYGETFTMDGSPAKVVADPPPTPAMLARGALKMLLPHPEFFVTKVRDPFRPFERGNNAAGDRGPGTDGHIAAVFLNVLKTRLNDPTLWLLGGNQIGGDFRQSGCTACHVVYANDADPVNSGDIAKYGHSGLSFTADKSIPKNEPGHPIVHRLTSSIPSSQCLTCHHHQGNGALGNYQGMIWWDRETDAEPVMKAGGYLYQPEQASLASHNGEFKQTQFQDQHGHSWTYQNVYLRNRRGLLLDGSGAVIPDEDPQKWQRAVHLKDIHLEKGMQCIDCHTHQDMHGDGNIYAQMTDAIEIKCEDCHGTVRERATLITSGPPGGNDLRNARTPFGKPQFQVRGGKVYQNSRMSKDVKWEVPQIADSVDPSSPSYNPKSARAKTMQVGGAWGKEIAADTKLAHDPGKLECFACHSAWNTNCYGCHLPIETNVRTAENHYTNKDSRAYAPYNQQGIKYDSFLLGVGTTDKGNKITPMRSASAVVVSAKDRNRNTFIHQQPTVSTPGFSGYGVTPNPPHTVRLKETKRCTDCHLSAANDNNAVISTLLGIGSNGAAFIGDYAFIAENGKGVRGVRVAHGDEPQPVIGSHYDSVLNPDSFREFVANGRRLDTSYAHHAPRVRSVQARGEYLYSAEGKDGLRIYDIAAIDNKSVAQRIVLNPNSRLGQDTTLKTENATWVHLPSVLPMNLDRKSAPANQEQRPHPLFRYALVTDATEGLILADVNTFTDGDPANNYVRRAVTFNPGRKLDGAMMVKTAGNIAYVVSAKTGLHAVDLSDPLKPKIAWSSRPAHLHSAKAIAIQFRYLFVLEASGVKVYDITNPIEPQLVPEGFIPVKDARGIVIFRTWAIIAAGAQGIALVDVENPEKPGPPTFFDASGVMDDATAVTVGSTYASTFAYVGDGKNGLRVVRLIEPPDTPGHLGFSPVPTPALIATLPTRGTVVAVSEGQPRDRSVDESGNQIAVGNRLGSRPFNRHEMDSILFSNGQLLKVDDNAP
ncbi:MAG: hypothetical protein HY049_06640 [Acidobacteria bacterium]|nr:hypothetical protein [Acidobacteriota bacterium]